MRFENSYRAKIDDREYYDFEGKTPRATILPFFGFKMKIVSESHTYDYGGNTYVTKVATDTYKVSKSSTRFGTKTTYYKEFYRDLSEFSDPDLETQFQSWMKQNNIKDIWATPYICPNLEEFHKINGEGPKNGIYNALTVFAILLATAGCLITAIMCLMGNMAVGLPLLLTFCGLGLASFMIVLKLRHNKTYRELPLDQTDKKYQDALRARYYKGLTLLLGNDLGNAMRDFIIQREQLNIKK